MRLEIKKAQRTQRKLRFALAGVSGGGKTYSALKIARGVVGKEGRILLADTEDSSSTLYADEFEFDHVDIPNREYSTFIQIIRVAEREGYDILIIDSLSAAWQEFTEQHSKMQGNSFTNWAKITPKYNELIKAITSSKIHIIATMRAKTKYEVQDNGKPQKIGLEPVMRLGSEYEFDVVGVIDIAHNCHIEKTRFSFLADKIVSKPGEDVGAAIAKFLNSGAKPAPKELPKEQVEQPIELLKAPYIDDFKIPDLSQVYALRLITANGDRVALEQVAIRAGFFKCKKFKCWVGDKYVRSLHKYYIHSPNEGWINDYEPAENEKYVSEPQFIPANNTSEPQVEADQSENF